MLKVAEEEEWATISLQEEGPRPVTQVKNCAISEVARYFIFSSRKSVLVS